MHKTIFKTVLAFSREYWQILAAILGIGITQTVVGMSTTVFFQQLIDGLVSAHGIDPLILPLAAYIGLNILNHILVYLEGIPTSQLEYRIPLWVKLQALQKIARIDYQAYQDLGTGNLIQTIENGADSVRNILTNFYLQIFRGILPQFVVSMAFIGYYDRTLFYLILAGYGVFFLIAHSLMGFLRRELEKMLSNQENFSKFSVRAFMEMVVFRLNGRFKAEFERVNNIADEIVQSRTRIYLLQELFYTGFALLVFLVEAGVVIQQTYKIIAGTSTVGTLVALVTFIRTVFGPITSLSMALVGYRMDAVTFQRFQKFIELPDDGGLNKPPDLTITKGQICFEDVSFAYQSKTTAEAIDQSARPDILRQFSQDILGGQVTALVGASGSGKSTLIRLILHLLKPTQGKVLVDGQDLASVNLSSFYRHIAYVPQEPPIFDGTVQENLVFDRRVAPETLQEIIRKVGLDNWVNGLPRGLETVVGERGIKLSGGERQRLAFARVLLQNPQIVILDEPTSAMDSLTEALVTENMLAAFQGKTVIVVAHRLQTVRSAQQILVLENGVVIQKGTFAELLSKKGKFFDLWEKQTQEQLQENKIDQNTI